MKNRKYNINLSIYDWHLLITFSNDLNSNCKKISLQYENGYGNHVWERERRRHAVWERETHSLRESGREGWAVREREIWMSPMEAINYVQILRTWTHSPNTLRIIALQRSRFYTHYLRKWPTEPQNTLWVYFEYNKISCWNIWTLNPLWPTFTRRHLHLLYYIHRGKKISFYIIFMHLFCLVINV